MTSTAAWAPGRTLTFRGGRQVDVAAGPGLLANLAQGPGLAAHQSRYGDLPAIGVTQLQSMCERVALDGRGGAGFPFARKLESAAKAARAATRLGRAPYVVVNVSEGEPASRKDSVLARVAPHLVLDGAAVTARAIGAREVHLVTAADVPEVGSALRTAVDERRAPRRDGRLRFSFHDAAPLFVAGQSAAVLQLMAGRPNLPVTSWQPSTVRGHHGRPTLLSNAETYAHVGRLALLGTPATVSLGTLEEPGTTLLTLDGDLSPGAGRAQVMEVGFGTPWPEVLGDRASRPVLLGGYHGAWAEPGALNGLTVSRLSMADHGLQLGAGVVLPLDTGCPVTRSVGIVDYLAGQSARRCGPCFNGLPALAIALRRVAGGEGGTDEVLRLADLVDGRGACAHPDGTARLVRSLLTAYAGEVAVHARGGCGWRR